MIYFLKGHKLDSSKYSAYRRKRLSARFEQIKKKDPNAIWMSHFAIDRHQRFWVESIRTDVQVNTRATFLGVPA